MDTTNNEITGISLFSGYGGLDIGIRRVLPNLRIIAYVERESYAVALLEKKIREGFLDEAPIFSDVTQFPAERFLNKVHLVIAGYPCQDFSSAGKREGLEGSRGQMWGFTRSVVNRCNAPAFFGENVEGHLSLGFDSVVSDLAEDGYRVEAGLYSASEVGAPHQRKRIFSLGIKCDITDWGVLRENRGWLELGDTPAERLEGERLRLCEGEESSLSGGTSEEGQSLGNPASDGREDGSSESGEEKADGCGEEGRLLQFEGAGALSDGTGRTPVESDGDIRLGRDGSGSGSPEHVANDESERRGSGEDGSGSDVGRISDEEREEWGSIRSETGRSGSSDGEVADSSSGGLEREGGARSLGGEKGQEERGSGDQSSQTDRDCDPTGGEEIEYDYFLQVARLYDEGFPTIEHVHGEPGPESWPVRWPARPGQDQYDWEPERTVVVNSTVSRSQRSERESLEGGSTGSAVTGGKCSIEPGLGGDSNVVTRGLHENRVDRLRLCGNGVLWLTAAKAFSEISYKHEQYIKKIKDDEKNS